MLFIGGRTYFNGGYREEDKMGVVRLKEELGSLLNDWEVIKLELDHKGYTCDYE